MHAGWLFASRSMFFSKADAQGNFSVYCYQKESGRTIAG